VTSTDAEILVVGGDPLDALIRRYGPFVMNSAGDLQRAVRDYQSGRMGVLQTAQTAALQRRHPAPRLHQPLPEPAQTYRRAPAAEGGAVCADSNSRPQ
jgi:hypothetical protein